MNTIEIIQKQLNSHMPVIWMKGMEKIINSNPDKRVDRDNRYLQPKMCKKYSVEYYEQKQIKELVQLQNSEANYNPSLQGSEAIYNINANYEDYADDKNKDED